ncbi:succinate dehydrogenase cytochrome b subunit [uncultured Bacteroides sp.]|uniref:succinate dehydrogenase cytochrome b subunit n=1 Tax=uncultured Bacteroides sp. TaxID=162156 RepID=UPI002AAB5627|nr:succinate dehydrogenase cytochrome b subunit [uncultured Bacteroides sp.]
MKSSSIGRKLVMSISGMFLIMFLTLHLAINFTAIISREAYERASHFMSENIFIKMMVPVLALGFIVHIAMGVILTIQNRKARPTDYTVKGKHPKVSWASKNMFALGIIILGLLIIHLNHFWAEIQLQEFLGNAKANPYDLVVATFSNWWNVSVYVIWILAIGFHVSHGFWSMFQSMGLNNDKWLPRLRTIAIIYSYVITTGYIIIPIYFFLGFGQA